MFDIQIIFYPQLLGRILIRDKLLSKRSLGCNNPPSDLVKATDIISGFYESLKMKLSSRKCLEHLTVTVGQSLKNPAEQLLKVTKENNFFLSETIKKLTRLIASLSSTFLGWFYQEISVVVLAKFKFVFNGIWVKDLND